MKNEMDGNRESFLFQWLKEENKCFLLLFCLVLQLHREFLRAGADVMQTFTFYASDDKLRNRGNTASEKIGVRTTQLKFLSNRFRVVI